MAHDAETPPEIVQYDEEKITEITLALLYL